jgi:hypothetical protein
MRHQKALYRRNLEKLGLMLVMIGCLAPASQAATKQSEGPAWVRYTDNAEGAFSMDVPLGWQVQGGMYRFGYFDVRWMMEARSLDGKVIIRINDPSIPPYVLPGPHTGAAGRPFVRPNLFQMVIDNFREAQPYAESYAKKRFASACNSFVSKTSDWVLTPPAYWSPEPGEKSTQASLAFDCPTSDGARVVNVYARTATHGKEGLWTVDAMISLLATPDKLPLARSMTQHMIDSWEENPQWKQYQDRMTQVGLAQMKADFGRFMQQMAAFHQQREAAMNQQVAQFESRQHAQAAQVSSWGNILTGITNLYDPTTGTQFQVFSGPKANYYMNGNGVKINSDIDPGNGFHQVENLGP